MDAVDDGPVERGKVPSASSSSIGHAHAQSPEEHISKQPVLTVTGEETLIMRHRIQNLPTGHGPRTSPSFVASTACTAAPPRPRRQPHFLLFVLWACRVGDDGWVILVELHCEAVLCVAWDKDLAFPATHEQAQKKGIAKGASALSILHLGDLLARLARLRRRILGITVLA